jgi:asparagine synthase (glutamine-hydrolysing)
MINRDALYGYCCFSYVPTPDTPVKDIHAVEAGQEIIFSGNAFKKTEREIYTFSSADATITDEDEAVSQLETQLKTALQKQISDLNDEPVGICLSGGLDSSLIAALLVKAGLKVRAYTLDFSDVILSETPYAERVAEYLDIPLIKIPVTAKAVIKVLP